MEFSEKISTFSLIRILIVLATTDHSPERETYQSQLFLLLESLDDKSRALLKKRVDSLQIENKKALLLLEHKKQIIVDGLSMSFQRRRIPFDILRQLSQCTTISLSELTAKVWGAEFNESYYHRIRVNINRLNRDMERELSLKNLLVIDRDFVRLNAEIKVGRG